MGSEPEYRIEAITSIDDYEKIRGPWDELAEMQMEYSPFLGHSWHRLWIDHFMNQEKLLILLAYQGKELKLLCPLMLTEAVLGGLRTRQVRLIGNTYSPIKSFLFHPSSDREALLTEVFTYLMKNRQRWDVVNLDALAEEDESFEILQKVVRGKGLTFEEYHCFGNWYLTGINYSGTEYMEGRSGNIRNNAKRYEKKLKKTGKLELRIVTDGDRIDHYMEMYYRVYEKSWKEPERDPTFHLDVARLGAEKGWLRLGFLFYNDDPIASQLWLVENNIAYIVNLSYDQSFKQFIPGIILTAEMMKYVIDVVGVRQVDYLSGDEAYKKDWTPLRRQRSGLVIFNHNKKGRLLTGLYRFSSLMGRKRAYREMEG